MGLYEKTFDKYVWGFKYRPKSIDEMILPERLKLKFNAIIDTGNINNLLLHGEAGVGKTTIAFILNDILDRDALYINGTKEGVISTVRDKMDEYCSTVGWKEGVKKLVIVDEFDGFSDKAEKSLKVFIETYGKFCDFIFITNHIMEIDDKLKSRLQDVCFDVNGDDIKHMKIGIARRLVEICKEENVDYNNRGITVLVNEFFPDFRKILNESQNLSDIGGITEANVTTSMNFNTDEFLDAAKEKNYQKLQNVVINLSVTPARFFNKLFTEGIKRISPDCRAEFILQLSEYLAKSETSTQPQIHLCAFAVILMQSIKID